MLQYFDICRTEGSLLTLDCHRKMHNWFPTSTMKWLLLVLGCVLLLCEPIAPDQNAAESCFCKLQGDLDDCSCTVESIDSFNNDKIFPRLKRLLERDFFRYYKANMFKPCPFTTAGGGSCSSVSCAVNECKDDQIPAGLRNNNNNSHGKNKYTKEAQGTNCKSEEHNELGDLDTHISDQNKEAFEDWRKHDDAQDNFCELEDEDSPEAAYYDLVRNPERFTGYTGASAVNVWKLIYDQNCFKPDEKVDYTSFLSPTQDLCLEKRVFYRMISGFHTSINVDVTANWLIKGLCLEQRTFYRLISGMQSSVSIHLSAIYQFAGKTLWDEPVWGPNVEEFRKRFDPDKTYGEGPNRLKNLYFTYLVELRALVKVAPYLQQEVYYTGSDKEDTEVKETLNDILEIAKTFPNHFDESQLFQGDQKKLMENFKIHFRNISRIMDCVGCDKCRLWGKLQITGMGTALKILFSGDSMRPGSTVTQDHRKGDLPFQLQRGEIVALLNAFGRLSQSIHELDTFRRLTS